MLWCDFVGARPNGKMRFCSLYLFVNSLVEMPKSQGHGQALVLEPSQADAVVAACSPAMRAVFSVARCTALRISEVLNLKGENITSTHVVLPVLLLHEKLSK